jgi:hypothetical protein
VLDRRSINRISFPIFDYPELHVELACRNTVIGFSNWLDDNDGQLFSNFSYQRRGRRLTRANVSTGKVPDAREPISPFRPQAKQNLLIFDENGSNNVVNFRK